MDSEDFPLGLMPLVSLNEAGKDGNEMTKRSLAWGRLEGTPSHGKAIKFQILKRREPAR